MIRPAHADDVVAIREVERRAGQVFREIGMDDVADDELPSVELLQGFVADGRMWVDEKDGAVVGFVVARELDDSCHVAQVSVDPACRGERRGAALIAHVASWAASRGFRHLTLTTFAAVPWNAPYYERLGFAPITYEAMDPALREVFDDEAKAFAPGTRVAMARLVE